MSEPSLPQRLPRVVFYTKPGCHLCEVAEREIEAARCVGEYTFEKVNIETDATLLRRYGWEIPVIAINGVVVFKHRLTAAAFREAIKQSL